MNDAIARPGRLHIWECPDAPAHLRFAGNYVTTVRTWSGGKYRTRVECLPVVFRGATREQVEARELAWWTEELRKHAAAEQRKADASARARLRAEERRQNAEETAE